MPRAARPKPPHAPKPSPQDPDPHMHAGKCTIRNHPQCAEIERAFGAPTIFGEKRRRSGRGGKRVEDTEKDAGTCNVPLRPSGWCGEAGRGRHDLRFEIGDVRGDGKKPTREARIMLTAGGTG